MAIYTVNLDWKRNTPDFESKTFDRAHTLSFPGGTILKATSAPEYFGDPALTNPEELFVSALSSCFMLTFLSIASVKGFIVNQYSDSAKGTLEKNHEGKMAITEVTLNPTIVFENASKPNTAVLNELLEKAHANCFISNSVKTTIHIKAEP